VSFVLDNSIALTWCFEEERPPEALRAAANALGLPFLGA
jgi:hypothetical protein